MGTPLDTTILSSLHRCDDCGRIVAEAHAKMRNVVENLWVPLCPHCHEQRLHVLDRAIHLAVAQSIISETQQRLNQESPR